MRPMQMNKFLILLLLPFVFACEGASSSRKLQLSQVQKKELVQKVTIAGTIEPEKTAAVAAPFDGYVKKLYVKVGDDVKQNDPLVAVSENLTDPGPFFPIRAPFSGKVVQVNVKENELAKAQDAQKPILRVDDLSHFVVKARVPEVDILKIQKGHEVLVKASAILNKQYKGKVVELALASASEEQYSRTSSAHFPISIKILDPDDKLRSGMSVVADVISQKIDKALVLPHAFISTDREGKFVTLRDGGIRRIQIGAQNEMFTQVIGLEEGTEVQQVDFYSTGGN